MAKEHLGTYAETLDYEEDDQHYVVRIKIIYEAPDHFTRIGLATSEAEKDDVVGHIKRVFQSALDSVRTLKVEAFKNPKKLEKEKLLKTNAKPFKIFTDAEELGFSALGSYVVREFADRYGRGVELGELS